MKLIIRCVITSQVLVCVGVNLDTAYARRVSFSLPLLNQFMASIETRAHHRNKSLRLRQEPTTGARGRKSRFHP